MCVGGREDNENCGTLYTTISAFFLGVKIFFLQIQWSFRISKFEKEKKKKRIIRFPYIDQVSSQKYIRML
jgi:hypothetical protein